MTQLLPSRAQRKRWISMPYLLALLAASAFAQPLILEKQIPLPAIEGRLDHMAADPSTHRLFLAAFGNNTVEVIDTDSGQIIHTLTGLKQPQGILFWPEGKRFYVANAADGRVTAFDASTYAILRTYDFNGGDADNFGFDPELKEVWVGYGEALGVISAPLGTAVGDVMLGAHPESFQLETHGQRVFVNVPEATAGPHVSVIDRRTRSVTAQWPLPPGITGNYPLALDEPGHRLFVGCRKPAELLTVDTQSGKMTVLAPIPGDADDLFYDATQKRIYVSGGEGSIAVLDDAGKSLAAIPTAKGARTSLSVPELKRLFVAVPHHGKQQAELLVFRVGP